MLLVLGRRKLHVGERAEATRGETVRMSITTAMTSVPKPAPELIEAFRDAPTCIISDNLARLPGAVGLRPFHRGGRLVGTAFTVRTRPGDNLAIHQALELVGPGDVIVVDGGGDETQGAGRRDHEEHRRIPRRGGLCDRRRDPRRCGVRCVGLPVLCPRGHTSRPLQERPGRNQRAGFHRRLGDQSRATSWWATRTAWCRFRPRSRPR